MAERARFHPHGVAGAARHLSPGTLTMALPAARVLLTPLWLIQLATGAKSFLDNPLIGSQRLNRLGLHLARVRTAAALTRWRRRRLARAVRPDWREAFDRDGFVVIPEVVPADQFPALRTGLLSYRGPAREMRQGDAITRRMAVDPDLLSAVPALRALLERKDIVALFHYVASFRTTPLHYIQTIVSHAGGNEADPQETLHADSFHPSLKAWLFLNPVSVEEGPFCYVRGSHRFDRGRLDWEYRRSLADPRAIDRLSARGSPRVMPEALVSPKPQPSFAFRCSAACSEPESAHGRLVQITTLCLPTGFRSYMP